VIAKRVTGIGGVFFKSTSDHKRLAGWYRDNLGLALANSNAAAQAVASWQSTSDPASAHNNLAVVWIEKGNYAEARKELELALSYNKANPAALRNLELVSRIDGAPATVTLHEPPATRWARWRSSVKRLFVGPLEEPRKDVAKTASAN
jgi:tetratricopeptide (TPR) repeat protein